MGADCNLFLINADSKKLVRLQIKSYKIIPFIKMDDLIFKNKKGMEAFYLSMVRN